MSLPMSASYDPEAVESAWYSYWEQHGLFKPDFSKKDYYSIVIPPPNVTGSLHLGHALTVAIQDTMTRFNRMLQKSTLFLPGIDHAGIATQIVVEKRIMRESGKTRHDLGRDNFIKEVWKWKEQYGNRIYGQLKRLGTGNDWTRAVFTMDEKMVTAVNEAFVRLHEEGTIYRENRLVNWCTKLRTALSNLEVENIELEGKTFLSVPDHDPSQKYEFGTIVYFAYILEGSDERIIVATTRLETMLGDTAVAVHSKDERYKHLIGKFVTHPFHPTRRIPIIADDYVDPEFGTGAVKITPAHDPNDFAIGKRASLEFINIFTDSGAINANGSPEFEGMQRFDARKAVLARLKELGLYVKTEDNKMVLPICTRSNNIIEPLLKPQWYVSCKDMAGEAMAAVRNGSLTIAPAASEKDWFRWLENIQDWCISRQLWWGHRIPAYLICIKGVSLDSIEESAWVSGRTFDEAMEKARARHPEVDVKDLTLDQDPDVLDTWFSAGLWPFATLGWPEKTPDFQKFYPTSLLETGWDILFFWVARMAMLGIKLTGNVPFTNVFCHAMVRDAHGRKMSKSLGNVIDPLDVIDGITLDALHALLEQGNLDAKEVQKAKDGQKRDFPAGIPKCGADALRFTLLTYTSAGRDINLDVLRIEGYRKFCNKLWNAVKFGIMKLGDGFVPSKTCNLTGRESLAELWILSRLSSTASETNTLLHQMNFMAASNNVYNFWLYELCDVYIEVTKSLLESSDAARVQSAKDTLYTCLDLGLKLLHPMMPYVTEELYHRLPRREGDSPISISVTQYPQHQPSWSNEKAEQEYALVNSVVHACRSLLTDYGVKGATIHIQAKSQRLYELLSTQDGVILNLVKGLDKVNIVDGKAVVELGCALFTASEDCDVYLVVKGFVDFDAEIAKFSAKVAKTRDLIAASVKKTKVPDYENKVKVEIREANEAKIKALEGEIEALLKIIGNFEALRL